MKRSNVMVFIAVLAAIAIIVVVVVGASGSKSNNSNNSSQTGNTGNNTSKTANASETDQVTIQNFAFSPATIKVKVGTKVTWTNKDSVAHTVTADTKSSDAPASGDIAKDDSFSFTFSKAGTYAYHCAPHPYMHGTVIVTE